MKDKIGVFICMCGSNISDYVDVEKVKEAVAKDVKVAITKTTMFACSDATQKEIVEDIKENNLDALVIASCSPKLHLTTFRNAAERAGMNPYNYVHANIREQASWAHSNDPEGATAKAIQIVKAAIAKVKYSEALIPSKINVENTVMVIGAGVAGMRSAIDLADMGSKVYLIERSHFTGGRISQWETLFPTNQQSSDVVKKLYENILTRDNITLLTGTELISNSGSVGNFKAEVKIKPRGIKPGVEGINTPDIASKIQKAIDICPVEVEDDFNFKLTKRKAIYHNHNGQFPEYLVIDFENCTKCGECVKVFDQVDLEQKEESVQIDAGAILLTTGFDPYEPETGEFGYGEIDNVISLPQFKRLIETQNKKLTYKDKEINSIAYIYCVGSRQPNGENKHCSRYCCTSTFHSANQLRKKFPDISNYHINRGIRTYGKQELLYKEASINGDIFIQFTEETFPEVIKKNGNTIVTVVDMLTAGKEFTIEADLVVLVTGMTPRKDNSTGRLLKVPVGRDKFFNEIHPKLKPVETVIDGVYIAGTCQGPYNISETVKTSLSAASKANTLLKTGEIELEPTLAMINAGECKWCDKCTTACPFNAIIKTDLNGKAVAEVNEALCKGCGICLPVCPENAINLKAYTDTEMETMIDAMIE